MFTVDSSYSSKAAHQLFAENRNAEEKYPRCIRLLTILTATRGITRDEHFSLRDVRSSVWNLRRNLLFHLST